MGKKSGPLVVGQGMDLETLPGSGAIAALGVAGLWWSGSAPEAARVPVFWVSVLAVVGGGFGLLTWVAGRFTAWTLEVDGEALEVRQALRGVVGRIPLSNLPRVEYGTRMQQSGLEAEHIGLALDDPDDEEASWPMEPPPGTDFAQGIYGGFSMPLPELSREIRKRARRVRE
ncbi:MAG: hypothetical protein K2W96_02555 [Gemmataceae bacterium]|nr:hypothetical protein [Gemmataceae bacterium]